MLRWQLQIKPEHQPQNHLQYHRVLPSGETIVTYSDGTRALFSPEGDFERYLVSSILIPLQRRTPNSPKVTFQSVDSQLVDDAES